jgi:hypothetical protein
MSSVDEAGVAGGVVSNVFIGGCWFSSSGGAKKVLFEGKPALPKGARSFHNGDASFNTRGLSSMPTQSKVMVN